MAGTGFLSESVPLFYNRFPFEFNITNKKATFFFINFQLLVSAPAKNYFERWQARCMYVDIWDLMISVSVVRVPLSRAHPRMVIDWPVPAYTPVTWTLHLHIQGGTQH